MKDYQEYINALRKCSKEHENDSTFTGQIIVSDLCRDTATLLEELEQESKIGHWIKKDYWKALPFDGSPLDWNNYDEKTHSEKVSHWYCSECDADKGENRPVARFCENCGARMIEP